MAITKTFSLKSSDFGAFFSQKSLVQFALDYCLLGWYENVPNNTQTFQHSLPSLSNVTFVIQGEVENLYQIENLKRKEFK
jgi:hypothetical protein